MDRTIGEVIAISRQNLNMTQEEFASRLGVTPQAVSKWERSTGMPDISLLPGICNILHISANSILGINENTVVENNDIKMEREIKKNMFAEPLLIEFGTALIQCFIEGLKTDYVNECRKKLVQEKGMLIPVIRIIDNINLYEREVVIRSYDKILYRKTFEAVDDTTFREIITTVKDECERNYDTILNKQLVKGIIDNVKTMYPGVADGLIPDRISYFKVLQHLRKVVKEQGNIRDIIHILEELETEHE